MRYFTKQQHIRYINLVTATLQHGINYDGNFLLTAYSNAFSIVTLQSRKDYHGCSDI